MIRGTTNDGRTPSRKRCRGNLRPAPFAITPSVVARVLALAARPVARAVLVPLSPVRLVDRPRRSQDPRLAKVNDDQAEQSSFSRLPLQEYGRKRMADGGGVSLNPQALVDRGEASPHPIQRSTTTDSSTADHAGGCEGQAAEVTSGAVAGGRLVPPANARQPHTKPAEATLPSRRTGKNYAQEIARLAAERENHTVIQITRCPGKATPPIEIIRAAAKALQVRPEPKIDWSRVAAAHAARPAPPAPVRSAPLEPAPNREECPRCGILGWKGCAHFLPCEETFVRPNSAEDWRKGGQGKSEKIRFTGKRQGIGVLPI